MEYTKKSAGHKKVTDLLKQITDYKIVEEFPVAKLNSSALVRGFFDIAIPQLKVVIEIHGIQHEHVVDFSGLCPEKAIMNLQIQKYQDMNKERAAVEAGWGYIAITSKEVSTITSEQLLSLLNTAVSARSDSLINNDNSAKERARLYRHERYLKFKQSRKDKAK